MLQISVLSFVYSFLPFYLETLLCFVLPLPDLSFAFYSPFKTILSCPLNTCSIAINPSQPLSCCSSPESWPPTSPESFLLEMADYSIVFINPRIGKWVTCPPYTFPPPDCYFFTHFYHSCSLSQLATLSTTTAHSCELFTTSNCSSLNTPATSEQSSCPTRFPGSPTKVTSCLHPTPQLFSFWIATAHK